MPGIKRIGMIDALFYSSFLVLMRFALLLSVLRAAWILTLCTPVCVDLTANMVNAYFEK
jgi:hypothetical protein